MFDLSSTSSVSVNSSRREKKGFGWFLGGSAGAVTAMQIILICLFNWIAVKDGGNIGAILSSHEEGESVYQTYCKDHMTKMECGYLFAMQVSAIVAILFGGLATALFCIPKLPLNSLASFLAALSCLLQLVFGIMMIVIFGYFKRHYYDDDGVNREYESSDSDSLYYTTCFYLWIASVCCNFVVTMTAFLALYKKGFEKKDPVLDA